MMIKIRLVYLTVLAVFWCFFCGLIVPNKHPFYFSFAEFEYNYSEKAFQGSIKIFINDLEQSIKKDKNQKLDLLHVKDTTYVNSVLHRYLNSNLSFDVNGSILKSNFVGFECEGEVIYLHVEFLNCKEPKQVSMINTILYDLSDLQTNFVTIKSGNQKKTVKLVNPEKFAQLIF